MNPDYSFAPSGHRHVWAILAGALLAAESWLFTWGRNSLGDYISGIVLTLCGLTACVVIYGLHRGQPWPMAAGRSTAPGTRAAIGVAALVGAVVCVITQARLLPKYVVDIYYSDIIPSLSIYTRRFLAGEDVYRPFTNEVGYFLTPTYLPATWGPYLLPEVLRFDYRWLALGLLLAGLGTYAGLVRRLRLPLAASIGLTLLPFFLTYALQRTEPAMFGFTVEAMIIGYYFLLLSGLLLHKSALVVPGLVLCLLSRYALVLWVPLLLGLMFWQGSRRQALRTAGLVGAGILAFYVGPFLSHDWLLFARMQESYNGAALGEWQHLGSGGRPFHLYNGIGLGNLLYRYGTGTLAAKILLLKKIHFAALVGTVAGAALLYWRERPPRTDYRVFSILVLKFYLVLFYALLQVPYAYLASVSLLTSCFLVLLLVRIAVAPDALAVAPVVA